jgi:hypothetical protein
LFGQLGFIVQALFAFGAVADAMLVKINNTIYIKEGNLFITLSFSNQGAPCCTLGIVAKPLMNRSASKWFHNVYTKNSKKMKCTYFKEIGKLGNVQKPLMIEFLGGNFIIFRPSVINIVF